MIKIKDHGYDKRKASVKIKNMVKFKVMFRLRPM